MYTEKEAKDKWCPTTFASYTGQSDGGPYTCEASKCMAWRWGEDIVKKNPNAGKRAADGSVECDSFTTKKGYCGLAGKP
jgi:hypothetical protein